MFFDWFVNPSRVELTGTFSREKRGALRTGGIRQGFWIVPPATFCRFTAAAVGPSQIDATERPASTRAGQDDDADVRAGFFTANGGGIGKNQAYGANFFYKLSSNVIASFETLQTRTTYLTLGNRLNNHYDLAFAYLF